MTLEDAIEALTIELGLIDVDDEAILKDILIQLHTSSYSEGWADGYAKALEEEADELEFERGW
jgi:hypothetical protein